MEPYGTSRANRSDSVPKVRFVGFNVAGEAEAVNIATLSSDQQVLSGSPSPVIIPALLKDGSEASTSPRSSNLAPPETSTESSSAAIGTAFPAMNSTYQPAAAAQPIVTQANPPAAPVPVPASTGGGGGGGSAASAGGSYASTQLSTPPQTAVAGSAGSSAGTSVRQTPSSTGADQAAVWTAISTPSSSGGAAAPTPEASRKDANPLPPTGGPPQGEKKEKEKLTRAERRAIQEAQRAAKAAKQAGAAPGPSGGGGGGGSTGSGGSTKKAKDDDAASVRSTATNADAKSSKAAPNAKLPPAAASSASKKVVERSRKANELFSHLPQYDLEAQRAKILSKISLGVKTAGPSQIPRAVLELCLQFLDGSVQGGSERTVALLQTIQKVIADYTTPPGKTLSRDLTTRINGIIQFLIDCRPMSVSMGNAIRFVKLQIAGVDNNLSDDQAKAYLVDEIEGYIQERILFAHKVIVQHAVSKIQDGDVILTHAFSSVVAKVFITAHELGRKFKVVVADSRPQNEGRKLLKQLLQAGLSCHYVHINALAYQMREVTKVLLGAAAVLSNGTVISRVGTASCAMVAHSCNIPVLIACETCKFHERVQLDSITSNELGDPLALASVEGRPDITDLHDCQEVENLKVLNLVYDAMPKDFITLIISEFGMIPPTSVPVILREYRKEPTI